MDKEQITDRLAARLGISKAKAMRIVVELFGARGTTGIIEEAIRNGDRILLSGFGVFEVRDRKPRTSWNPHAGARFTVPRRRVVWFVPGKRLADQAASA